MGEILLCRQGSAGIPEQAEVVQLICPAINKRRGKLFPCRAIAAGACMSHFPEKGPTPLKNRANAVTEGIEYGEKVVKNADILDAK